MSQLLTFVVVVVVVVIVVVVDDVVVDAQGYVLLVYQTVEALYQEVSLCMHKCSSFIIIWVLRLGFGAHRCVCVLCVHVPVIYSKGIIPSD